MGLYQKHIFKEKKTMSKKIEKEPKPLLIPTEYSDRFYAVMDEVWAYDDKKWKETWDKIMPFLESLVK